jgi:hypothetical protein
MNHASYRCLLVGAVAVIAATHFDESTVEAQTVDVQSENIVALYRFDEGSGTTAADSAINDGIQTAIQNAGTIGWTTGLIGGAVDLDGASSLIAPDAIGEGATAFTISLWVNIDNASPGYDGIFSARNLDNEGNSNWGINYEGSAADNINIDYRYALASGTSAGTDSPDGETGPNGGLAVDKWVHAAMTWTADGSFRDVYMNGVDVGDANGGAADVYTGFPWSWRIGDDDCCGDRFMDGQIDEIAVWNVALSAGEIGTIYTNGMSGTGLTAPIPLPPDATNDGLVNSADFQVIRTNFGRNGDLEEPPVTLERTDGDVINDNKINFDDYGYWKQYPKDPDPAAFATGSQVPEPSALVMIGAVALLYTRRRWR